MAILELILLLLLLLFGGVRQDASEQPIVIDEPITPATAQDLIDYGNQFFTADEGWTIFLTLEEGEGAPSVAWTDSESEVVIHIFEETIPLADPLDIVMQSSWIEGDFSEGYQNIITKWYCQANDVYLYQLSLEFDDELYVARVWQYYVDDRLIRGVRLVFPADRADELESYAQILFPDFYTCED